MSNVTVTFRRMVPQESLLTFLRDACGRADESARWSVAVEPQGDTTRVEIVRHAPTGPIRVVTEHSDPLQAASAAAAHFDAAA